MALALSRVAIPQESETMTQHNSAADRLRRTVSEILEVLKGQGLSKKTALQPVPVRADVPAVVRRPR